MKLITSPAHTMQLYYKDVLKLVKIISSVELKSA